ncbi:endonuclease [Loktanella sp. IMCC34160]|uniref:endonuclease/exonuclease/phosphatase family protein n=1 Tax=Loktanella sp. IMCC34160 TaxID=2510646 RepID=UPI00101C802C|nr:endonuclease/exonuclease/phosphatase family protein [Loktanella sp. IMCC34160]RYG92343.1 endonuclease [Loktanella sp. IMCC34160]
MRIATYNVEWFDNLFDDTGKLIEDHTWSGRQDVRRDEQIAALGHVFTALDADAVMVIEAPDVHRGRDGVAALENFAARFDLRARKALIGFQNDTQQEIMLLYDPDRLVVYHDPQGDETGKKGDRHAPRFDSVFRIDLDVDADPDLIRWSKPPLEVAARTTAGREFRLIGVHAKSKAPHGARSREEIMRVSIENRRKQLAQCIWLRQRVEQHLEAGEDLIVLGDFNDGPGLDEYEKLFGRSSIEIVLGENGATTLFDPHAKMALGQRVGAMPTTARFRLPHDGRYLSALLDYVMVSPGLERIGPEWRIWHPFDDCRCYEDPALRESLLIASDHFPVSIDIDL